MDVFHASNLTVFQPDFYPMRMKLAFRQDVFDDAIGQLPGALILFQNNAHFSARTNIFQISTIHIIDFKLRLAAFS